MIAAKFVWPELLGTIPQLTYGRLRPLHVNGMLFGWLLAADMGLTFYLVPRLCGVQAVEREARRRHGGAVERDHPGRGGLPAAGLEPGARVRRTAAAARHPRGGRLDHVRRQRLRDHRHPQVPRDVRVALVHHGHHPVDGLRLPHRQLRGAVRHRRQPGQPELDVRPQRGRPDLHAGRPGARLLLHPQGVATRRCYSHKLSMVGFWSLAFVYVWTGAHHMLHGPDLAVAADDRDRLLGDAADPGLGGGLQLLRDDEGPVAPAARQRAS